MNQSIVESDRGSTGTGVSSDHVGQEGNETVLVNNNETTTFMATTIDESQQPSSSITTTASVLLIDSSTAHLEAPSTAGGSSDSSHSVSLSWILSFTGALLALILLAIGLWKAQQRVDARRRLKRLETQVVREKRDEDRRLHLEKRAQRKRWQLITRMQERRAAARFDGGKPPIEKKDDPSAIAAITAADDATEGMPEGRSMPLSNPLGDNAAKKRNLHPSASSSYPPKGNRFMEQFPSSIRDWIQGAKAAAIAPAAATDATDWRLVPIVAADDGPTKRRANGKKRKKRREKVVNANGQLGNVEGTQHSQVSGLSESSESDLWTSENSSESSTTMRSAAGEFDANGGAVLGWVWRRARIEPDRQQLRGIFVKAGECELLEPWLALQSTAVPSVVTPLPRGVTHSSDALQTPAARLTKAMKKVLRRVHYGDIEPTAVTTDYHRVVGMSSSTPPLPQSPHDDAIRNPAARRELDEVGMLSRVFLPEAAPLPEPRRLGALPLDALIDRLEMARKDRRMEEGHGRLASDHFVGSGSGDVVHSALKDTRGALLAEEADGRHRRHRAGVVEQTATAKCSNWMHL